MKNKATKKEQFTSGTFQYGNYWTIEKGPLKFANSDELRNIQNRNRKRK